MSVSHIYLSIYLSIYQSFHIYLSIYLSITKIILAQSAGVEEYKKYISEEG